MVTFGVEDGAVGTTTGIVTLAVVLALWFVSVDDSATSAVFVIVPLASAGTSP